MPDKKSDLLVINEMVEKNMDISASVDLLNFERQKKRNGGLVTIGVACPAFDHLINQAATGDITHLAVLYIVNRKQFEEIKNKPSEDKAAKWDALAAKMEALYAKESDADLSTIGEISAQAFGYL